MTLDRNGGGPDDSFSLEYKELKELCLGGKIAWKSSEKVLSSKASCDINRGTPFTFDLLNDNL